VSGKVRFAHRLVSWLVTIALVGATVLAVLMVVPSLLGYQRYVIISGSMEPTLPVGSVVYDEVVPVDDIVVGDIITFVPPPEFDIDSPVTHRVVEVAIAEENSSHPGQRLFRTKGDNNEDVDPWRMVLDGPDQARVEHHVPYVGYFYMALQVRWVQLLLIVVPAVALVTYIVITLWRVSGEAVLEEKAKTPPEGAADQDDPAEPDGART
jgi:signal peptidase I